MTSAPPRPARRPSGDAAARTPEPDPTRLRAVLAAVHRGGAQRLAERLRVHARFAVVTLDLRDAVFPPGGLRLELDTLAASLRILLPATAPAPRLAGRRRLTRVRMVTDPAR
ncbi:hypothetical protein [Allostreptomyces psammosilenae]|uniref:Uncharacterized protein n=1 Tax=Allostreptomyces psammosilenae TaxID=1892865 RepID=A0A852ZS68_9ACTN|nr:hypothetical protein [Allostreptomyces psammosilenae]NYI04317.1 hypothetical protein [Allostreptomyces psammosilenae]